DSSVTGVQTCALPISGIATDDTTKFFFQSLMGSHALVSLYDFENKGLFPGVDSRFKFSVLTLTGTAQPATDGAQFSFFAHAPLEIGRASCREGSGGSG